MQYAWHLHISHDPEFFLFGINKDIMSENLNGKVSKCSWSMPTESNCSLDKCSQIRSYNNNSLTWIFSCISFAMSRPGMSNRWVLILTIPKLLCVYFQIGGLSRLFHRLLSSSLNLTNPNRSDRDTLSNSLIQQQELGFARV